MADQFLELHDWNKLFFQVPGPIQTRSNEALTNGIRYHDEEGYIQIKKLFRSMLSDIGEYETICYPTGSDAIEKAIIWVKVKHECTTLFRVKGVYHGVSTLLSEQNLIAYDGMSVEWTDYQDIMDDSPQSRIAQEQNAIVLIEPLHFISEHRAGHEHFFEKLKEVCERQNHKLIIDEIRSGAFKTNSFALTQKFNIHPTAICFAKGLALGVPLAAACFDKALFDRDKPFLSKVETHKSSLVLNSLALERANAFLSYAQDNRKPFHDQLERLHQQLVNGFQSLDTTPYLDAVIIIGSIVILIFNKEIFTRSKLKLFRMMLFKKNILLRSMEENKLFLTFPFDTSEQQIMGAAVCIVSTIHEIT